MSLPKMQYLKVKNFPILEQLQLEEALLRADCNNWCLINQGSPPAIVMGISGKKEVVIQEDFYRHNPLPVIRRFSGGGTVVIDEHTLFITLICNSKAVSIPAFPEPILQWNGTLFSRPLGALDFKIRESDYVIGMKKFGGNAQYIRKNRWVHHSTLLWDYCKEKMNVLALPGKMPAYRMGRNHEEFLGPLKPHFSSQTALIEPFLSALSDHFTLEQVSLQSARAFCSLPHRKVTQLV